MNSQPVPIHPDARIDRVLEALGAAEPPAGLEQRIAARLAQAGEARMGGATRHAQGRSAFAVFLSARKGCRISLRPAKLWAVAATVIVVTLTTFIVLHHRRPATAAHAKAMAPAPSPAFAKAFVPANARASQGFGFKSHPASQAAADRNPAASQEPNDPDAIALAETLAPSRPAPPMPLTPQEHLLAAAMRPGQPIQLAELDTARAPFLRAAAEARETASLDHYVKSLLAPFALAEALQPTTFAEPREARTPPPPPPPDSSN